MVPEKLDLIFPYLIFVYGLTMTLLLNSRFFSDMAETRLPYAVCQQIKSHRGLGLICLLVGAFWSLQNIWL
jgi:hypothetical protein